MPDQHVADREQTVLRSEGNILVRSGEFETIRLRMDDLPLEDVLGTDRAEMAPDEFECGGVLPGDLGVVERGAEEKTLSQDFP
jgi:hypothetical protein